VCQTGPCRPPRGLRVRPVCVRTSCSSLAASLPRSCGGTQRACALPCERLMPLYPRGPRSGPGYNVLVHLRLIGPMRAPLAGTSRLRRTAVYTRCPRCASYLRHLGDPRVVPCFRWPFFIDMSPSETPGSSSAACTQFLRQCRWPSTCGKGLGTSHCPHTPILVGSPISGLDYGSLSFTTCRFARPPVGADQVFTSRRGLLLPGFRRIGHPLRRRISLQWQLGKFH
jgi:hypothetical protein